MMIANQHSNKSYKPTYRTTMLKVICFSVLWIVSICAFGIENLDRGLIAMEVPGQGVYLGWRLLADDPANVQFDVYRKTSIGGQFAKINSTSIVHSTNYLDKPAEDLNNLKYRIAIRTSDVTAHYSKESGVLPYQDRGNYISIPLSGDYDFQKCAIADLDGDGAYDFVIKQPDINIDPQEKGWKPSATTYKLEAYNAHGGFLWRHDMGWGIETGVWYSPYIAYDLNGDGKAEVYTKYIAGDPREADGRVRTMDEHVAQLDGITGEILNSAPWLSREGYAINTDNHSNRNMMAIAYLDGKKPGLILHRGIYDLVKTIAYDSDFQKIWYWDSNMEEKKYWHASAHGLFPADIDDDGRDEIVYGSAVLDEYGKGLWTLEMGHCDFSYVGDILPSRSGYEIFYGFETWQDKNGICLVEAATGDVIWGYDQFIKHVHSQGMCADIMAEKPGMELYGGQKDGSKHWLYDAEGNLLHDEAFAGLAPRTVKWDADPQQELILDHTIISKGIENTGNELGEIEGKIVAIADILGDWREEIITSVQGELRIYTTNIAANSRQVCLMQNRLYRNYVATVSMGYFYPPISGN